VRHTINKPLTIALFKAYGIKVREREWYAMRLFPEEVSFFIDWYHTTGSTVLHEHDTFIKWGKYHNAEELAMKIEDYKYEILSL